MPIGSDFNIQTIPNDIRRLKRFYVGNREFLTMLNRFDDWPEYINVISRPKVIPNDARVHGVYIDYARQGYCIIVEHPSYPEVPPGAEIPVGDINLPMEQRCLKVIDKAVAIPDKLKRQNLEEILGYCLTKLEDIAETEEVGS